MLIEQRVEQLDVQCAVPTRIRYDVVRVAVKRCVCEIDLKLRKLANNRVEGSHILLAVGRSQCWGSSASTRCCIAFDAAIQARARQDDGVEYIGLAVHSGAL